MGEREFQSVLCKFYMIVLLVVLPLYTGGTYYQIGDSKYLLFRNVSFLCLGMWILLGVVSAIGGLVSGAKNVIKAGQLTGRVFRCEFRCKTGWSIMDSCVLCYGVCAVISAVASTYGATPWMGYRDWYMGAISQLLFVGIYFLVSREYTGTAYPIYLGEAALFAVTLFAFLQRCGLDLLGLQKGFQVTDWEYSHMLSTVGNINWLCGYLCVLLPWPVVGYLYSKRRGKQIVCYVTSVSALVLTLTQGSDIGMALVAACLGLCMLYGIRRRVFFQRGILLALGVCVLCPAMGWTMHFLDTQQMLAADGFISGVILKPFWWWAALVLGGIAVLEWKLPDKSAKCMNRIGLILICLTAGLAAVLYLCRLPAGTGWGSGRGGLWQAAWRAFCGMNPGQKLWGMGPDCFAEYIYDIPALAELTYTEGHWADSIFANAHNEWLNQLVNQGILGVLAYLSVFVCGLRRYRGMLLGVFALILYGINSLFGFQQVMSTPFLFLVLGICEYRCRNKGETIDVPYYFC